MPTNTNFTYSYQKIPNSKIEDRFKFDFIPVSRELKSWREEVIDTAKKIANSTTKPLYLCLSGGIDSEVMALAFIEAGIKFKVLTVKNKYNSHDTLFADNFCKKNKLEQSVVEYDVTTFHKKYVNDYPSRNLFRYLQLFILETVENLGGTAVLGGGEQIYYTVGDEICIKYDPGFIVPLEWCKNNNTVHYPYFHMQNPEILAAYMSEPLVNLMLSDPTYHSSHHFMSLEKIIVYHGHWKGMERRAKYNGFENLFILRKYVEDELDLRYPDIEPLYIPVSRVKTQLGLTSNK
jgi:hypothetical protein